MACMENRCTRYDCDFFELSNELIKECPRCGDKVINFFDEDPYEYESPSGDDYDDMVDFED